MAYNPNILHFQVGYNPLILTIDPNFQRDILVGKFVVSGYRGDFWGLKVAQDEISPCNDP